MAKIFVLSEYVNGSQNSTGYFWEKLISRIERDFGSVEVIAPDDGALVGEISSRVVRYSFHARSYKKEKIVSRIWGQLILVISFLCSVKKHVRKNDLVVTGTNPMLLLLVFPIVRWWVGFRWVLLVHDVFPENLVPAKILKGDGWLYRLIVRLFNAIYRSPDCLIVIGRDMKELLLRKVGGEREIRVIQNWVSENDIKTVPRDYSEIISRLGWQKKIVFTFFGNIGRVQGIGGILKSIPYVESPRAAFLFIGEGAGVGELEDFISSYSGDNIKYIGGLDQSEKNEGLAACDVALVTLAEGMLGLGVPSKAYFAMAADRPILAVMSEKAEVAQMVTEFGVGWVCEQTDAKGLARKIDWICEQGLGEMQVSPRSVLIDNYSEQVALDRFIKCLQQTMKSND